MDETGESEQTGPGYLAKAEAACSAGVEVAEGEQLAFLRRSNSREDQGRGERARGCGCCPAPHSGANSRQALGRGEA